MTWLRLLCWLFGHAPRVSFFAVPVNGYRCARCNRFIENEPDDPDVKSGTI